MSVQAAATAAQPRTDHRGSAEYKRQLVRVFVTRLLGGTVIPATGTTGTETSSAERAA